MGGVPPQLGLAIRYKRRSGSYSGSGPVALLSLVWPSVINVGQDLTQDRVPSHCFPDITEGDWKGEYLTNVEDAVCFHLLQSCGGKRKS